MSYLSLTDVQKLKTGQPINWPFQEHSMMKIFHVANSINNALNNISQIDPKSLKGQQLLEYEGMTGTKTRHFYNNLCSFPNTRYLEIGTWYGSSSISAMYQNDIDAVFIENWTEFGGDSDILLSALKKFATKNSSYKLIENDCFKVDTQELGKFNVYLYDGYHSEEAHFKALSYFYNNLDDEFVFIVDDYNWEGVRTATENAIKHLNIDILFKHEIIVPPEDLKGMPSSNASKNTWWNGIGIFVLRKN